MSKSKKTAYLALFLSTESKKNLLNWAPPRFKNISADHMTVAFKPTPEELEQFRPFIGKDAWVRVNNETCNERIQAVVVAGHPPIRKERLHVTISWADGVQPSEAKELVKEDFWGVEIGAPSLYGVWDTFPRTVQL